MQRYWGMLPGHSAKLPSDQPLRPELFLTLGWRNSEGNFLLFHSQRLLSQLDLAVPDLHVIPDHLSCCLFMPAVKEIREPLFLQTQLSSQKRPGLVLERVLMSGWLFLPRKNAVHTPNSLQDTLDTWTPIHLCPDEC